MNDKILMIVSELSNCIILFYTTWAVSLTTFRATSACHPDYCWIQKKFKVPTNYSDFE